MTARRITREARERRRREALDYRRAEDNWCIQCGGTWDAEDRLQLKGGSGSGEWTTRRIHNPPTGTSHPSRMEWDMIPNIRILGLLNAPRDFLYDLRFARTRDEVWDCACGPRLELAHRSLLLAIENLTAKIANDVEIGKELERVRARPMAPPAWTIEWYEPGGFYEVAVGDTALFHIHPLRSVSKADEHKLLSMLGRPSAPSAPPDHHSCMDADCIACRRPEDWR